MAQYAIMKSSAFDPGGKIRGKEIVSVIHHRIALAFWQADLSCCGSGEVVAMSDQQDRKPSQWQAIYRSALGEPVHRSRLIFESSPGDPRRNKRGQRRNRLFLMPKPKYTSDVSFLSNGLHCHSRIDKFQPHHTTPPAHPASASASPHIRLRGNSRNRTLRVRPVNIAPIVLRRPHQVCPRIQRLSR